MKKIIIILDGLADLPLKELGNKTPLEVAKTPNLDYLARKSLYGLMWPVKGIAPESDLSQFLILGGDKKDYLGRGVIEALGTGIKIKKDCIYMRVNFAEFSKNKITNKRIILSDKDIGRVNKISQTIKVYKTVDYRGILEIKNASENVTNTHPGYKKIKNYSVAIDGNNKLKCFGDKLTSERINNFIENFEIINGKTLLLRGAGKIRKTKTKKLDWNMIGEMPVEIGLAKLFKMKVIKKTKNKIKEVINSKKSIYVQIKGPDTYGHRGDYKGKIKAIENIDKMLKLLCNQDLLNKVKLCITADHATPCLLKRHSNNPVPILITGRDIKGQNIKKFCEAEVKKGSLKVEGKSLMKLLNSI